MFKRRRPRMLRKPSFATSTRPSFAKTPFWQKTDAFFRHPFVLVLVSFILTGVVGLALTDRYQQQQRDKDAIRKSMDEIRVSLDNTHRAFEEFIGAALDLNDDLEAKAPTDQIARDRTALRGVRHNMESTLTFETASLDQQMPYEAGGAFSMISSSILIATSTIDDCLSLGEVVDFPGDGPYGRKVFCNNKGSQFSIRYADERILQASKCIFDFYYAFRPSPLDDFQPGSQFAQLNSAVQNAKHACSQEAMLGITPKRTAQ